MKLTNEIFDRYTQCMNKVFRNEEKKIIALSEELGYDNPADFEEDIFIWAINHGDKAKVMEFFGMDEGEYEDSVEAWADESERGTK